MAGFMDALNKGIATINVKTSNFMDGTKLKTEIATKEKEIEQLKLAIGDAVCRNGENFTFDMVFEQIKAVEEKTKAIEALNKEISELTEKEKNILGRSTESEKQQGTVFCMSCGTPNSPNNKFCVKCGAPMNPPRGADG